MINWKSKYLQSKKKYLKIKGGMYQYRGQESPSCSPSRSPSRSRSPSPSLTQSNSTAQVLYSTFNPAGRNSQGISQLGHTHDCVAGSLMCGEFIFQDSYIDYLKLSKGIGLQDHEIEELIHKRYPSANLTPFETINNISNAFSEMPNNVVVPIILQHQFGTKHMVLIGKSKDGIYFLRDQQKNHYTDNNINQDDSSYFIGPKNIEQYLSGYTDFRVVLHEDIDDISQLIKNLEF